MENNQARYTIPEIRQKMSKAYFNETRAMLSMEYLVCMDTVYLFFTENMLYGTANWFHEPLLLYSTFET